MESVKPLVVSDIKAYLLYKYNNKENIYCVGSIEKDKYIEVGESIRDKILTIIGYFNGTNTLEDIKYFLEKEHRLKVDVEEVYKLLRMSGLIENEDSACIEKNEYEKFGMKIVSFELKKYEEILKYISKALNLLIIISVIIIIFSIPKLLSIFKEMLYLNIFKIVPSAILSLIISIFITTFSVILHEFSHAIVASNFGLKPSKFNISLYLYFNPIAYINIPGIYTLERKKRIYIWISGVYCNLLILSICVLLRAYTVGIVYNIVMVTCYTNLGLIISNLVPFLPLDGYFVVATLLKIPNLRKKSLSGFKRLLISGSIKKKENTIYIIYSLISIVMMIYLTFSQLSQMYYNFMIGWNINNNILDGLNEIKIYILMMAILIYNTIHAKVKKR